MNTANPIIHLNGNSGPALLAQYEHAMLALHDARTALGEIEFHQRDYYPVPGSWEIALAERREMFTQIGAMQDTLGRIHNAITNQIDARVKGQGHRL